ncbi:hypothetical protein [Variovorax paradoxus]|uniref:hypothetical protein n=1 Tax=Variovorax paradoxus TaxID=34073 RepID=UPI0012DA4C85|nr:hypothetical protein [Variovorax paradoxus]
MAISSLLRGAGNRTVIGLIDWDLKNKPDANVLILGLDDRYAIDNYILDPVAVGLLLLREGVVSPDVFGLNAEAGYLSIAQADSDILVKIAVKIVSDIHKRLKEKEKEDVVSLKFQYAEGFSIELPRWLAVLQGHRLEAVIKEAYPALLRYRGEPDLKRDVIGKIFKDRPGLIPVAIVDTMKAIQAVR